VLPSVVNVVISRRNF